MGKCLDSLRQHLMIFFKIVCHFAHWAQRRFKLASFKEEQLPYRSCAAIHVGAAVLAQVARSRRSEPLLDEQSFS